MDSATQNGKSDGLTMRQRFENGKIVDVGELKNRISNAEKPVETASGWDAQAHVKRLVADLGEGGEAARGERSIVARLRKKFGLGDAPRKRMALYLRIEQLAGIFGDPVFDAVSECVAQSVGKEQPGRYFAKSIALKLTERGFTLGKGNDDASW